MQEQPGPQSPGQAATGKSDRAGASGPQAARQQLPHAQKYMLLHTLGQQLEAGHVDGVIRQLKEELDPSFLDHHPDLMFELQRCECCMLQEALRLKWQTLKTAICCAVLCDAVLCLLMLCFTAMLSVQHVRLLAFRLSAA